MKTSELTGAALNWAVARCEGIELEGGKYNRLLVDGRMSRGQEMLVPYNPSTNWAQGGPIIERELIDVLHVRQNDLSVAWDATFGNDEIVESGPTLLIAAMRCYCCSKLGDEVDIPEELCQSQNS